MLHVAGYQGPSSILTQGLRCLVDTLKSKGWKSDIDWIPNVTDHQEKAADLFASIEKGTRQIGYMASGYLSARVPELYRATLDAIGFNAVTSDVKDLVSWIAHDVVQAQENPLTNYMGFELWKYHPYVSLTHHFYGVLLLVCPLAWYDSLNQEERQLLAYAVKTCTALQRQLAAEQDAITLARMQDIGVKVLPKDAMDMQAFHKSVESISFSARAQIPKDLLAAYLGS